MPAETSNAPRELWAVIDPTVLHEGHVSADGIWPTGLVAHTTDEARCREMAEYRDEGLNRTRPERKHLPTGYVRRDLVVPTVDELDEWMHGVMPVRPTIGREYRRERAEALHAWLLSRIEGDNDELA